MTRHPLSFALAVLLSVASVISCSVKSDSSQGSNTTLVTENDTEEQIISKAVSTIPSARQKAAMDREFIAFVHFGPNTFTAREWGTGSEDPAVFNPGMVDTDQWCRVISEAGMKMVILTVKHHDGFVLWQSRYTSHGVMSSPYQEGKGDILRQLCESCVNGNFASAEIGNFSFSRNRNN